MLWIILIIALVLFFILGMYGNKKAKKDDDILKQQGYWIDKKILTGKYLAGHPNIDVPIKQTVIYPTEGKLAIMEIEGFNSPIMKGNIEYEKIKNISVEDNTTIEKRITVARLLLTGIFAFALRKNKKTEMAYLVVDWNDGKFNHETIFEFTEKGAMQNANTARNALIKMLK